MKIQLVVFDMAGTTVCDDDAVNSCLRQALEKQVAVSRDQVNAVMGLPKPIAIQELLKSKLPAAKFGPADVEEIHADFLGRMLSYYRRAPGIGPMPHTEETFIRLKEAGVRVALDTGFSRSIVDAILERLRWREGGILDATVASDEVRRGRPLAAGPGGVSNDRQAARLALAFSAMTVKAGMSWTARSARILRSMARPALLSPSIICE